MVNTMVNSIPPVLPTMGIYVYAIVGFLVGINGLQYLPRAMRTTPSLRVLFSYLIALGWPIFALYVIFLADPEKNAPPSSSSEAPQNQPYSPKADTETIPEPIPISARSRPTTQQGPSIIDRGTHRTTSGMKRRGRKRFAGNGKARTRQPNKQTANKSPAG